MPAAAQETISQALQALLACETFSPLKPSELRELASLGEFHVFHEGDGVAIEGEPDDRMFIVLRGVLHGHDGALSCRLRLT